MSNINDAQAIRFSNEEMRKFADLLSGAYQQAKAIQIKWVAEGIAAKFPNTTDAVDDGAAIDGRTIITGSDINNLKATADALVTLLEQNGLEHQITVVRCSVNPRQ